MPRKRQGTTVGAWFSNQLWNTSLAWLLGLTVVCVGFYFTTNSKLEELDKKANDLQFAIKESKNTLVTSKKEDAIERDKVRDAFIADSKATATGIAELNKQTAVMGATLLGVQKELEKITQKLDSQPIRR